MAQAMSGGDGDQAELEGDAEHHDVDELLGAEAGLAISERFLA